MDFEPYEQRTSPPLSLSYTILIFYYVVDHGSSETIRRIRNYEIPLRRARGPGDRQPDTRRAAVEGRTGRSRTFDSSGEHHGLGYHQEGMSSPYR